jgi:hypothetical protein
MPTPAFPPDPRFRHSASPGAAHAPLPLRIALERGALVTVANWPIVLIDFTLESYFKLMLAVPAIGGALMVAALVGTDIGSVIGEGIHSTIDLVLGSLVTSPVALLAFLAAMMIVAVSGALMVFGLKAGTFATLVDGERQLVDAPDVRFEREWIAQAAAFRLARVYQRTTHFARRIAILTAWLCLAYAAIAAGYLLAIAFAVSLAAGGWGTFWPLLIVIATSIGVIALAAVNLVYDLLRVIVLTDDCETREAIGRLREFVIRDARQVIGLFSVITGVTLLATAISVLATAGLTLVAWVPFISLAIVPIQAAAWIVRGLIFQAMALTALSAYQAQYRRFLPGRAAAAAE